MDGRAGQRPRPCKGGCVTEQLTIGGAVDSLKVSMDHVKPLTARQQQAFDYVREHDGVNCDEVGAWLHAHRDKRPHSVDERCDWCARDGRSVLTSVALKPLVTYRNLDGQRLYIARNPADRVRQQSAQLDGLPDWLGGDAA